jgi:hypothetical protein
MSHLRLAVAVAAACLVSVAARAQAPVACSANLSGAQEVPAHQVPGTGQLTAQLDPATKTLTYSATYSGLTGPATMAHFHGPAAAGANAGVAVGVKGSVASPINGTATLTDAQIADLKAGKWYFNVHTKENPGGEIRGQVTCGS